MRTTNAIERAVPRSAPKNPPDMGVFQDKTSMDRIRFAVFTYENKSQRVGSPSR